MLKNEKKKQKCFDRRISCYSNSNGHMVCRIDGVAEMTPNIIPLDLLVYSGKRYGKYHDYHIKLEEIKENAYDNYKVMLSVIK